MNPTQSQELHIDAVRLQKVSFLLEAALHPVRQQLLCLLSGNRRMPAKAISASLAVEYELCIQHLSILCGVGLLRREKEGAQIVYAADADKLEQLYSSIALLSL